MGNWNNIDDAVRNSFEEFEMPFDASQWNMIEKGLDQNAGNELTSFDEKVKESVSGHEVAYNSAAWTAVESQLVSTYSYTKWIIAAGVVGLISFGAYWIATSDEDKDLKMADQEKVVAENTNNIEKNSNNSFDNKSKTTEGNHKKVESTEDNSTVENTIDDESNPEDPFNVDEILPESFIAPTENTNQLNSNTPQSNIPVVKKWSIASPQITGPASVCEGEKIIFNSSDVNEKINIRWYLNGNLVSENNELSLENISAGIYQIELVHAAKTEFASTCTKPESRKETTISVLEKPASDFKYFQQGDAWYPEMKFEILSPEKNIRYSWMVDNQMKSGEEMIHLFNKKGNYSVSLMAEYENGCTTTETKNIDISTDYNLLAPIAFTPNMDGLNDEFIPEALKYLNLPFKLNIYDRQQGLVFHSSRADFAWDGRNINTGENCGQGAYLWVVELTNKNGEIEQYTGTITILK